MAKCLVSPPLRIAALSAPLEAGLSRMWFDGTPNENTHIRLQPAQNNRTPRLLGHRWVIVGTDATGIALPLIGRALTLDSAISKAMMRVDQLNPRVRFRALAQAYWAERWLLLSAAINRVRLK